MLDPDIIAHRLVTPEEFRKVMRIAVTMHIGFLPQLKGKGAPRGDRSASIHAFADKLSEHFTRPGMMFLAPEPRRGPSMAPSKESL